MTLPTTGALSLNDIQTEFGGTNPISLSEYYAGGGLVATGISGTNGAVPSSGAISISNFYGTNAGILGQTFANLTNFSTNFTVSDVTSNINNTAWNGSIFLALSFSAPNWTIRSSSDGVNWNTVSSNLNELPNINSLLARTLQQRLYFANGRWVITSPLTPLYFYSSNNGVTWTSGTLAAVFGAFGPNNIQMAYSSSLTRWCVVAYGGAAAYSTDGITWTSSSASYAAQVALAPNNGGTKIGGWGCVWNGSRFISFGYSSNGSGSFYQMIAITSDDGITWAYRSGCATAYGTADFGTPSGPASITYDNITFCRTPGYPTVYTSDGINYTKMSTSAIGGQFDILKLGSTYVAVSQQRIATSTDLVNWTTRVTFSTTQSPAQLSRSSSQISYTGSIGLYYRSTDGTTFPIGSLGNLAMTVSGIIRNSSTGLTVVVGNNGTCATSTNNGSTWTSQPGLAAIAVTNTTSLASLKSINYNGINYVATGLEGSGETCFACYSPDGITWTRSNSFTSVTSFLSSSTTNLVWNGTTFLVGESRGSSPRVVRSTNGITWTFSYPGFPSLQANFSNGHALAWSPTLGLFILTNGLSSSSRALSTSPDGITWTNRSTAFNAAYSSSTMTPNSIAVSTNSSLIVVVGSEGSCVSSIDGISWTARPGLAAVTTQNITTIGWTGSFFIASGLLGTCATSTDAVTWVLRPNFTTAFGSSQYPIYSYYNGFQFFILGSGANIVRSPS